MKTIFQKIALAIFLLVPNLIQAQEEHEQHESEHSEHAEDSHHKHMIGLMLGHTHLSGGVVDGKTQWLVVPSFALNYNYFFSHKWAAGLHTDIILEEFVVESHSEGHEETTVEREYPMSFIGMGTYKPKHWLALMLGGGVETDPHETFTLIRLGIEPSISLNERWEVVFSTIYDIKFDAYNSWSLSVGMARLF